MIQVPIDWSMLKAIISFWNPSDKVFCFGRCELCPTLEKLEDFLGLHLGEEAIIVQVKTSHIKDIVANIGLNKKLMHKEWICHKADLWFQW